MYRNDHDAALARIDALEGEVRRLQGELDRREAPPEPPEPIVIHEPRRPASAAKALAIFIVAMIYALLMPFHHHHHYYSPRPVPRVQYTRPAAPSFDRDYRALQRALENLRATESHVSQ